MKTWEVTFRVTVDVKAKNNADAINRALSLAMKPGYVIFTTTLKEKKAGALSESGRRHRS